MPPAEAAEPARPLEPRYGGFVRVLVDDGPLRQAVVRSSVAQPLTPEGLLQAWGSPGPDDTCWRLELRAAAYPVGEAVRPADLISGWNDALKHDASPAHWLLALDRAEQRAAGRERRLGRVPATRATDDALLVCPDEPTPDLLRRLGHPALWHWRRGDSVARHEGSGPFRQADDGRLVRNPGYRGPRPYLDHVELVAEQGSPALLFKLGTAHLAVAYGQQAQDLRDAGEGVVAERLSSWDRTYYLWLNPARRWVNDPFFRRWLSGVADRDQMVDYLFAGLGRRAYALTPGAATKPMYELKPDRPLAPESVPRLTVLYDEADRAATILARRLQEVLAAADVELTAEAQPLDEILRRMVQDDLDMALLAHHPAVDDPVLALLDVVWWLGDEASGERQRLTRASRWADREARSARAWDVEQRLLGDARIVPLVRLEAWLARHPQLADVRGGPDGVLRLGEAWWTP